MNTPDRIDNHITTAVIPWPDGVAHGHDLAAEFRAEGCDGRFVIVAVAADAVEEFLFGLLPAARKTGGSWVV